MPKVRYFNYYTFDIFVKCKNVDLRRHCGGINQYQRNLSHAK